MTKEHPVSRPYHSFIHITIWAVIFTIFLYSTLNYHPTFLIAVLASSILISASAFVVYLNRNILFVNFQKNRSITYYFVLLLVSILATDLIAVLSIQLIYDVLWGPDQNRFGFWYNFMSDGAIICFFVFGAAILQWITGRAKLWLNTARISRN